MSEHQDCFSAIDEEINNICLFVEFLVIKILNSQEESLACLSFENKETVESDIIEPLNVEISSLAIEAP